MSVPWLSSGALIVLARHTTPVLGEMVNVPVPLHVVLARPSPAVAVLKFCARVTAVDTNDRVPPVIAPPFQVKDPEETNRLSLAPIVMEPVAFEKLGLMPD